MREIRCVRNSDLPLIAESSGSWLGLSGLLPEARLQLFELGLFSKPSFEFRSCYVAVSDGRIDALVVTTESESHACITYANSPSECLDALEATLIQSLTQRSNINALNIGITDTASGLLTHVPGIIERSGLRASFFQLRDLLFAHGYTQHDVTPLFSFNSELQRPAFSRDQMELRRTHAIATTHDIVLPEWSLNLDLSHLNTLELQLQNRETGQPDATVVLTAIPDGQPSQSILTMHSCQGTEPHLSALVSDLCRGHQGTLFAILPECSSVLQNVGFEIADTFTTWQLD